MSDPVVLLDETTLVTIVVPRGRKVQVRFSSNAEHLAFLSGELAKYGLEIRWEAGRLTIADEEKFAALKREIYQIGIDE
jgi:hypothetical protein